MFGLAVRYGEIPLEEIAARVLSLRLAEVAEEQPWLVPLLVQRVPRRWSEKRLGFARRNRRRARIV